MEASVLGLANQLVVFAYLTLLLSIVSELLRSQVSQNFEFALKFPLLDFMKALLVVLVAEIVDR